jgi:hypothetical protein
MFIFASKLAASAALAPGRILENDLEKIENTEGINPLIDAKDWLYGKVELTIEPKNVCRVVASNGLRIDRSYAPFSAILISFC